MRLSAQGLREYNVATSTAKTVLLEKTILMVNLLLFLPRWSLRHGE